VNRALIRIAFITLACPGGVAFAADYETQGEPIMVGGYYGNLQAGGFVGIDSAGSKSVQIPGVQLSGKFAYDKTESPWGWQADGNWSYVELGWIKPSIDEVDGHFAAADSALHLTYRPTTTSKLGLFAGYSNLSFGVEDSSGGTFDLFDDVGLVSAEINLGSGAVGVEALQSFSDQTWIQGRVAFVDPMNVKLTASDGVTTDSESGSDLFGDIIGGMAGASLHHAFTQNISARAEATYLGLHARDAGNLAVVNVALTGNYTFENMPLSLGVSGGYASLIADGESTDSFTASTKLTWSFGGPSQGSSGKLFRGGSLGFGN
jgi:hypothetical protein